jgi:DNA-binding NtrC family response regulator
LLVEDDQGFARLVAEAGRQAGCWVHHAPNLTVARASLEQHCFDLMLLDVSLPDGNGLDLLDEIDVVDHGRIAVVTALPSVESAVRVVRSPVADYLIKPVSAGALQDLLLQAHRLALAQARMAKPLGGMIGDSSAMRTLFAQVRRVGPLEVSVLVHGESGTGKELVADALHHESGRKGRFVAVNCGAVAPELLGSHLFGHERGAFTGAQQAHVGFFEQAEGGTLFLDEITEMPLKLQVFLLRVLESRALTRVGGVREIPVDVRLIAATNRDPRRAVADGALRADLYYRLIEFPLLIPPLRARREDIPLLARHFLERLNRHYHTAKGFAPKALERMAEAPWPGNVRELRHAVQRNYILAGDGAQVGYKLEDVFAAPVADVDGVRFSVGMTFEEVEREMLLKTLARCGNNKGRAAEVLGITPKTIYNRLLRYRSQGLIDDSVMGDIAPSKSG